MVISKQFFQYVEWQKWAEQAKLAYAITANKLMK